MDNTHRHGIIPRRASHMARCNVTSDLSSYPQQLQEASLPRPRTALCNNCHIRNSLEKCRAWGKCLIAYTFRGGVYSSPIIHTLTDSGCVGTCPTDKCCADSGDNSTYYYTSGYQTCLPIGGTCILPGTACYPGIAVWSGKVYVGSCYCRS